MPKFCILSAQHDYRSLRRVNLHFIARELRRQGDVRFFSCRFSALSYLRDTDPRLSLSKRVNRIEVQDGIECFLWKTPLHPPTFPSSLVGIEALAFRVYEAAAPRVLRKWIVESDVIIIESGVAVVFFDLIKTLNPSARVIYLAADELETIGAASFVRNCLARIHGGFDSVVLTSSAMARDFPQARHAVVVPHGIGEGDFLATSDSPFPAGSCNGVSVGTMLFDERLFRLAAPRCPDVTFHAIGSGLVSAPTRDGNVTYLPEMKFADTIPYLKHANFGIAPYRQEGVPPYLADTSMKLMQFGHLGLPAICPDAAVGGHPFRFGYDVEQPETIAAAIRAALAAPHVPIPAMTWTEVTSRILDSIGGTVG